MALSLLTPWISEAPLDPAKARARFRGGAYTDAQVDQFLAALAYHAETTGMATAALAAQVAKETANFRYGGQVKPEQFNIAGIAATNDGAAGHAFGSIEGGVMGLIAHHGNYLFGALDRWPPAWEPYKPFAIRNAQVLAAGFGGVVRTIGDYTNGRWAWTPTVPLGSLNNGYARRIVEIGNTLLGGGTVALQKPTVDTSHPSPNRGYPSGFHRVDAVIWHVTAGSFASSLGWLTNPASGASANYLLDKDGSIYELVPPIESAWANGAVNKPDMSNPLIPKWLAEKVNFNQRTVSIETAQEHSANGQPGGFTEAQHRSLVRLTAWLCAKFHLTPDRTHIIRHAQIDSVNRKNCPGLSEGEMLAWIGEIAALVNGATPPPPSAPDSTGLHPYVNDKGETVLEINFGGSATGVEGVNIVDVGISVRNAAGEKYSRTVRANVFEPWHKD